MLLGNISPPVGKDGLGKAVSCPDGFPGRHASCCITDEGIQVAWLKSGTQGFFTANLVPGERAEIDYSKVQYGRVG